MGVIELKSVLNFYLDCIYINGLKFFYKVLYTKKNSITLLQIIHD